MLLFQYVLLLLSVSLLVSITTSVKPADWHKLQAETLCQIYEKYAFVLFQPKLITLASVNQVWAINYIQQ